MVCVNEEETFFLNRIYHRMMTRGNPNEKWTKPKTPIGLQPMKLYASKAQRKRREKKRKSFLVNSHTRSSQVAELEHGHLPLK